MLTDKYKPQTVSEFAGLEEVKRMAVNYLQRPASKSFLFVGASGIGKTAMAHAIARTLNGSLSIYSFREIDSQECGVDAVREIKRALCCGPLDGGYWIIVVNEAPEMTPAGQTAWLSVLDNLPPRTVVIFTGNGHVKDGNITWDRGGLELRFISRCTVVPFSQYGLNGDGSRFLAKVWDAEGGGEDKPDFARLLKDRKNNLRAALNQLESELLERGR